MSETTSEPTSEILIPRSSVSGYTDVFPLQCNNDNTRYRLDVHRQTVDQAVAASGVEVVVEEIVEVLVLQDSGDPKLVTPKTPINFKHFSGPDKRLTDRVEVEGAGEVVFDYHTPTAILDGFFDQKKGGHTLLGVRLKGKVLHY